jgi:hypothetical protein
VVAGQGRPGDNGLVTAPDAIAALQDAGLDALRQRHPEDWERVSEALLAALATGKAERLQAWQRGLRAEADLWRERLRSSGGNPQVAAGALAPLARERLARLALEKTALALAARESAGPVRFGLWSGTLVQRLLFARGLERKPASMAAFRLLWPLVTQRRLLMPLVQPRGIYCFYSRELVRALAGLVGGRPCLEIAAGDGTLSRFLAAEGVAIRATDDGSWAHAIAYPDAVERLEAREALRRHAPRAVICSWPPPGNGFERAVLATPGVELYVVVGSRHRFAAGDWAAYERQREFDWGIDEPLSRLVLPPELDPAVLVFRRRVSPGPATP